MNRSVLRLAVPSILANITIPLVGIVDVAITGHLSDASAVGGIAVGTMLFDLLYWNFGFLRVGTSGMTAQAYGRHNRRETRELLVQSTGTAIAAAVMIWLLQWVFVTAVLALMPCSPEVADFARRYFFIRVWAAPATLTLFALKGWFIGMQNTVAPMITDIVVNVVNMAASYYLAVYTPLGAIGVAWGTLLAQYVGLLTAAVCTAVLLKRQNTETAQGKWHDTCTIRLREALTWTKMRRLFVLNGNLFIRSLCFMVVYVGYTAIASGYGDTELAVSAIMMKLFMFFSYFVDGFAYAGEALTGKLGVQADDNTVSASWHKTAQVNEVVKLLFIWATAVGIVFSLVYWFFSKQLVGIMSADAATLAASAHYFAWLALMPFISSLAFMWDGIYIGATAAVPVRNCMIWSAVGFVVTYIALAPLVGIQALYAGYFMHLLVRTVYLTLAWRRVDAAR
ncbi:MAG: MATE family efflux transporter [Paludibacteraceae bacterium]|nr:MATE family efflux transporter [Paludibacteraceae bacterium]